MVEETAEEPAAPEPPPEPPTLEAIGAPALGRANIAFVTVDDGVAYDVEDLEAGFGLDRGRATIVIADPTGASPQRRVRVVTTNLAAGQRAVSTETTPPEGQVSIAMDSLGALRVVGGEVNVEEQTDEVVRGTLDLEVRHAMLGSEPTHLRARFHAKREPFYDAQLEQERIIRERLRR